MLSLLVARVGRASFRESENVFKSPCFLDANFFGLGETGALEGPNNGVVSTLMDFVANV